MIFLPEACRGLLGQASGEAGADIRMCRQSFIFLSEACRGFEFHVLYSSFMFNFVKKQFKLFKKVGFKISGFLNKIIVLFDFHFWQINISLNYKYFKQIYAYF